MRRCQMNNSNLFLKGNNLIKKYSSDAGYDIKCPFCIDILPGSKVVIDTGLRVAIPEDFCGIIKGRSSLALKDIECSNAGVIDTGYRGVIKVILRNFGNTFFPINRSDRIAQLIIFPVSLPEFYEEDDLDIFTERGENGFGSTGV